MDGWSPLFSNRLNAIPLAGEEDTSVDTEVLQEMIREITGIAEQAHLICTDELLHTPLFSSLSFVWKKKKWSSCVPPSVCECLVCVMVRQKVIQEERESDSKKNGSDAT